VPGPRPARAGYPAQCGQAAMAPASTVRALDRPSREGARQLSASGLMVQFPAQWCRVPPKRALYEAVVDAIREKTTPKHDREIFKLRRSCALPLRRE